MTDTGGKRRGILVIQSMGLGDVVFALPVLRVLKKRYPADPITFLTNAQNADLLSLIPEVDRIISYRSKTPAELIRLVKEVRRHSYLMAVVLNPIFRGSILARCSGAPIRVGYLHDYERKQSMWGLESLLLTHAYVPRDEKRHEVDRYLDLLRMFDLAANGEENIPRLVLDEQAREFGDTVVKVLNGHQGPLVAINPGAGWEMRRWPADRFAEVADWLVQRYDARIVYVGGTAEQELTEGILGGMRHPARSYAGQTTLAQLAGLLARCDLFLTNDTGSLHIAAALDVPTIALFGPGDPVKCQPLSPHASVLYHRMPCSPCQVQYTNKCQNNLCMKEIPVDEVKAAVLNVLGKKTETKSVFTLKLSEGLGGPLRKILYLQSTSEIGGADMTLLRTLEVLDRTRFEPHVLLPHAGPLVEAFRKTGCRVHFLPSMRKLTSRRGIGYLVRYITGYPPTIFHIAQLIRREGINLVHTNTIHNLYGFLAARFAGKPHLWHIREVVVQSHFLRFIETHLVQWFSEGFIVMSNAIAKAFMGKEGGFPSNIAKLYDGVDLEEFRPNVPGKRIRSELGVPEEALLVGTVCRLDPWKGVEIFLETAKLVHKEIPSARFLVCGGEIDGHEGYETVLRRKAETLDLGETVLFTGWRYRHREIPEVYGALDISVQCPIYPEPYGLANVEAMACGVPVVAVAQGGPTELCVQEETALLVPPGDPRATADAVLSLLRNPERRRAMGAAGRKRAENLFDRRQCVKALETLYDEVLAETPSRQASPAMGRGDRR